MTKDEMVYLLRTDVGKWNEWMSKNSTEIGEDFTDLSGIDLMRANLEGAFLRHVNLANSRLNFANLKKADLSWSSLAGADFFGADLSGACLSTSDMMQSIMIGANLEQADLKSAMLKETIFFGSNLQGADLTDAMLTATAFLDIDLRRVLGLENVLHCSPLNIDINTIYRSEGAIPVNFLRDAGVPEGLITQIPSLIGAQDGIHFHSCFISYSHKDEDFARRLYGRMRDSRLRVWYAPEEMKGGQKLHEQIETAIHIYDKLLVVLSDASLLSDWVQTEIRNARRAEKKTGKRKLFPVRLTDMQMIQEWNCFDADTGKDLGVELREYYIPDFSHWKDHDKFEAAFTKLLMDLKADAAPQI